MAQKTGIVVGGGIAGIVAARTLQHNGVSTVVIDKGRSVGGRMATRRVETARFDYGAQFFTARTPEFRQLVEEWLAIGMIREWSRGFGAAPGAEAGDGHPRYCGCNGMKSIVRYLSRELTLYEATRVVSISRQADQWMVAADSGQTWQADFLVMTPPIPQSLELLGEDIMARMPANHRDKLVQVKYEKCLALMVQLEKPLALGGAGALQLTGEPIRWLADNGRKKVSSDPGTLTIHAGPVFSEQHWSESDDEVTRKLLAALPGGAVGRPLFSRLHRWRYSQPVAPLADRSLWTSDPGLLAFAGDAFGGGRIEGAVLSGRSAAETLLDSR